MLPLSKFSTKVKYLFCDIDDTITEHGKLPAESYSALWELSSLGVEIIPVTGRPAGWCEMIARFWPVRAIIGENGAFYFQYKNFKMQRHFLIDESTRKKNQEHLKKIQTEVLKKIPGSAVASDQFSRLFDLAIDFCEDVKPLKKDDVLKIKKIFETHGAHAKISSIHVNGWFGEYDKLAALEIFYKKELKLAEKKFQAQSVFIGDSPNDEPLFGFFQNSVGVANVRDFAEDLKQHPSYVCLKTNAKGFVELAKKIKSINA